MIVYRLKAKPMDFFDRLNTSHPDAAQLTSRRQLVFAALGVAMIAGFVVGAAGLGASGPLRVAADPRGFHVPSKAVEPLIAAGAAMADAACGSGQTTGAVIVSTRLRAGQSMLTRSYRNAEGRREFAVVTPELVAGDGGPSVRMQLRVFSLDDAQVVLAGLEVPEDAESAIHPDGARIWTAEDIAHKLAILPPEIHRTIPDVMVHAGAPFSATLGESGDSLFFLEGQVVAAGDGGLELKTDVKRIAKKS